MVKDASPDEIVMRTRMVDDIQEALFQPVVRLAGVYIALALVLGVQRLLGHPLPPDAFTIGVLALTVLGVASSERRNYQVSKACHDRLRQDPPSPENAAPRLGFFLVVLASSALGLLSFAALVPVVAAGGALLDGNFVFGLSPAVYMLLCALLVGVAAVALLGVFRALKARAWPTQLDRVRRIVLALRPFVLLLALLLAFALPAWVVNRLVTGADAGFGATFDAVLQTVFLVLIGIAVLCAVAEIWTFRLGPALFRALPVRRSPGARTARLAATLAWIELNVSAMVTTTIISALGLAPLFYTLYAANPSVLVFLAFNILCSAHVMLTVLAFSGDLGRASLRLLRRAGAQYTVVLIVAANAALALGYTIGWIASALYAEPGREIGNLPFPGLLYALHERAPGDLPFLAQLEAGAITILLLLALSWLQIVISKRAWAEMALVVGGSAAAAVSPQILPPLQSLLETIVSADWIILHRMPEIVLALVVPAIKAFLGSEVEQIADPGAADWAPCASCDEPIEFGDRFCRNCGSAA